MARFMIACLLHGVAGFRHADQQLVKTELRSMPWTSSGGDEHKELKEASWWVRDDNFAYYMPSSFVSLDQNISNYYYALGNMTAMTDGLRRHRVGGSGRVHLFHLPNGPAEFPAATRGSRVSSLSELTQLEHRKTLAVWPPYQMPANYRDVLDDKALAVERKVMEALTETLYAKYLIEMISPGSRRLRVTSRTWGDDRATDAVVQFLESEFKEMGFANVCVQTSRAEGKIVKNVMAFVPGSGYRLEDTVTMGAHFDDLPGFGRAPGAVDNGSGSAAVLAMAAAFMKARASTRKNVYFILFGAEEAGLYGSAAFAEALRQGGGSLPAACRPHPRNGNLFDGSRFGFGQKRPPAKHSAITMDMIGWRNPKFAKDTVTLETKSWGKELLPHLGMSNLVNNKGSLALQVSFEPYGSDHESFLARGMPALLTIDNDGDAEEYPCYHKSCDTMENVNVRLATEISQMNLGGLLRLAKLQG
eukprot:TRINITY_DN57157_c0_g1_i1.p1 TRINITY_DN57157_c0_g1~~TRINITY_DN57157_c0_g1_i1.p1  ORF type:complete len:474 (+),score=77.36 TRINITY_DN57157_c0_g1_i1:56-1477(+)